MANTTLSSIGGVLQDSRANELLVMGIGDSSAKAGDLCGLLTTGIIEAFDIDSTTAELALGYLLPRYDVDMDTAPGAVAVELVVPQAGHIYGVHIDTAQAAACEMGWGLTYHATTAGILDELTNVEDDIKIAKYYKVAAGDTYCLIIWGE